MVRFKKCPKCGYYPQPGDKNVFDKCNSCGLNYSKYSNRRFSVLATIILHILFLLLTLLTIETRGGVNELVGAIKSRYTEFSQTTGTITSSEKVTRSARFGYYYEHKISYGFMVDDIIYVSNTITFQSKRKDIDKLVSKYPVEKEVVVYFDKYDPEFSVLEPNIVGYDQLYWGIGLFLICIISFWLVVIVKMNFKLNRYA